MKTKTTHGIPHKWIWNVESGTTAVKKVRNIRSMIDTFYDGNPANFNSRIVIFGCLNDLNSWAKSRDEPMPGKYILGAAEARNYLGQFRKGRVI